MFHWETENEERCPGWWGGRDQYDKQKKLSTTHPHRHRLQQAFGKYLSSFLLTKYPPPPPLSLFFEVDQFLHDDYYLFLCECISRSEQREISNFICSSRSPAWIMCANRACSSPWFENSENPKKYHMRIFWMKNLRFSGLYHISHPHICEVDLYLEL